MRARVSAPGTGLRAAWGPAGSGRLVPGGGGWEGTGAGSPENLQACPPLPQARVSGPVGPVSSGGAGGAESSSGGVGEGGGRGGCLCDHHDNHEVANSSMQLKTALFLRTKVSSAEHFVKF